MALRDRVCALFYLVFSATIVFTHPTTSPLIIPFIAITITPTIIVLRARGLGERPATRAGRGGEGHYCSGRRAR